MAIRISVQSVPIIFCLGDGLVEPTIETFFEGEGILAPQGGVVFDSFKGIGPIYFPVLKEADIDGPGGAEEGAAHAHLAAVPKDDFPVLDGHVFHRAFSDAFMALSAFIGIDPVEAAIDD